jgi:peptidoglycan/xylan/chitin deacetylase (PgdA/CDA1 family)
MLFYHRISPDRDPLAVPPERFREHMAQLAAEDWRVVDVVEAANILDSGEPTDRVLSLSFDDGYRDVFDHGQEVLEEHGFRATVFLATGVMDGTSTFGWYDEAPPLISWEDAARLDGQSPFRFEAHSVSHPNLMSLDEEGARREIATSKSVLEERMGRKVEAFSYPAGLFGARERRLVKEAGFRVAVSTHPGLNHASTDRLALMRNQIDPGDRLLDFRAKVHGGHDNPLPFQQAYRRRRYGDTLAAKAA